MYYPFSQNVAPAVRSHLDAQIAFMNDVSKSMFQSMQQMCELNLDLTRSLLEEATITGKQVFTAEHQTEAISGAASRAQPAADKLRAYQQNMSRLAAECQVELARVTEQHVQNTTRTAQALASEVTRNASEETERTVRSQQDNIRRFSESFSQMGNAAQQASTSFSAPPSTSMQALQGAAQAAQGAMQNTQNAMQAAVSGHAQGAGSAPSQGAGAGNTQGTDVFGNTQKGGGSVQRPGAGGSGQGADVGGSEQDMQDRNRQSGQYGA